MKERNFSLDVIRAIAVILVISTHFFLNSGFYDVHLNEMSSLIMIFIRVISTTCVPLFLLLTGFLKLNNKPLKSYKYSKILNIIIIYLLSAIAILIYKKYYLHIPLSFFAIVKDILRISGSNYNWYVEMYIGLFLLIPFLNIIWNNLKDKKEHKRLIITLLILCTLPSILNMFDFTFNKGLNEIFLALKGKDKIFPNWWINIYPIMYYFLGCYLKKHQDDLKRKPLVYLILFFAFVIFFGCLDFFRCGGGNGVMKILLQSGMVLRML